MSGASRRAGQKVFNWTRLSALVPEEARAEFTAFKAKYESCKARCVLWHRISTIKFELV